MSDHATEQLEYETLAFSRHLAELPGRSRRAGGLLDQSAYTLLTLLDVGGPSSIGELGVVTGLDASTLNRQTSALLRDGYASRISDPDGGIARKFHVTPEGRRILQDERHATRQALQRLTADWSDDDRATLVTLLTRLNQAIESRSNRHWPRP